MAMEPRRNAERRAQQAQARSRRVPLRLARAFEEISVQTDRQPALRQFEVGEPISGPEPLGRRWHGPRVLSSTGPLRYSFWRLPPGDLADFDEVPIRVTDIGANLSPVVLGLGQELGAFGRPFLVSLLDVGDPDVHKGAGAVRVLWGFDSDGGLVIGWAAAGVPDKP